MRLLKEVQLGAGEEDGSKVEGKRLYLWSRTSCGGGVGKGCIDWVIGIASGVDTSFPWTERKI